MPCITQVVRYHISERKKHPHSTYKRAKNRGGVLLIYILFLSISVITQNSYSYESITSSGVKKLPSNKSVLINNKPPKALPTHKTIVNNKCSDKGKYGAIIARASTLYGVDADLIYAVISAESCFNPKAVSLKGAQGLMQLMPFTAKRFGVTNSFDPMQNISGGVQYLRFLLNRFKGSIKLTVAAYNAGEGAVERYGGIPPYKETRLYVNKVLKEYGKKGLYQQVQFIANKPTNENHSKLNCLASSRIRSYTYLLFEGGFTRRYYLIKKGDSFFSISKDTGVEVTSLRKLNKFNADLFESKRTKHILVWECKPS